MTNPSRRAPATLLLGLLLALVGPEVSPQAAAQKPVFPAETELVVVDVVVSDRAGEPLVGLTREDFAVSEDGVPQELSSFEAVHRPSGATAGTAAPAEALRVSTNRAAPGQEPASFVIVFDELHLSPAEAVRARDAVTSFLETGVRDGDRVAVIGSAEGTRWTGPMPEGKPALVQVVARLQGKRVGESVRDAMSAYEAMRIDQDRDPIVTDQVMRRFLASGEIRQDSSLPGEPADYNSDVASWRSLTQARAAQVYARSSALAEQTLGIVERCLEALGGARGRKSLVLVSGGLVQDPRLRGFRRVVSESRRVNAALYFVDARGLVGAHAGLDTEIGPPANIIERSTGAWLGEMKDASEGSTGLALDTGGFVVENRNDLGTGFARIGKESRSYYLLGYVPTNRATDGRFRSITVKLGRPDVVVRARRGYFAPGRDDRGRSPRRATRPSSGRSTPRSTCPTCRCAPWPRASAKRSPERRRCASPRRPTSAGSPSPRRRAPRATRWSSCCWWRGATPATTRASTSSSRWRSRRRRARATSAAGSRSRARSRSRPGPTRRRSWSATRTPGASAASPTSSRCRRRPACACRAWCSATA